MKDFLLRLFLGAVQIALVAFVGYASFEWLMRSMVHSRQEVVVPDLKSKNLREAMAVTSKLHLALTQEAEEYSAESPVGSIIKQYPLAGSTVREGKIVSIVTSIGSEKIAVPELVGLSLRKAEIEIKAAQLVLGETVEIYSLRQDRGHVVAQDPKPLALAEKGDWVHVTISLGEPPAGKLIIPDFTDKEMEAAAAWAKKHNVTLEAAEDWSKSPMADGHVLKQSLEPDTVLDRDAFEEESLKLEITVARRAGEQETAGGRALEYKIPERPARSRELVLKTLGQGAEREIFRTVAEPGQLVKIPLRGASAKARIRFYLDGIFTEERTLE